ncbi:MAG: Npun_R2821/Npun_R2822 family protein [Cyanobacteria bacterium J06643_4]
MANGVYILANDVVFDQLIALLNSLEANAGKDLPICVIPYDDNTQRSRKATQDYTQVQWFDDSDLIGKWENFAQQIWQAHPTAFDIWRSRGVEGVNRMGMHRRFCCFDGPFEKFIYLDADILALNSLDLFFERLDSHDFVTYDFQYKDLSHVFDVTSDRSEDVFGRDRLSAEIFCAGLFASKKGTFTDPMLEHLLASLKEGDAEMLYFNGPDQSILNYMVMKSGIPAMNLSRTLPKEDRTGCCVTSPHFTEENHLLFDRQKQLTYLHYIGISAKFFEQVCAGKNILFPYRDLFLYYRYLRSGQVPELMGQPIAYDYSSLSRRQQWTNKARQLLDSLHLSAKR